MYTWISLVVLFELYVSGKKNDILLEEDLLGDQIELEEEVRDNREKETLQICMRIFNK